MTTSKPSGFIFTLSAVVLVLGLPAANAEIPADERILVTDPYLSEQMGFGPDEVVYLWTKGSFDGAISDYLISKGVYFEAPTGVGPVATGQVNRYAVEGRQFQERSNGFSRGSGGGFTNLVCNNTSTDPFADGQLQIHNGADLDFIRIWGVDSCAAENMEIFLFEYCQPDFAAGAITLTLLGSVSTSGSPGNFSVLISVGGILSVDNLSCTYQVRARFDDSSSNCTCGTSLVLNKARAQFQGSSEGSVLVVAPSF